MAENLDLDSWENQTFKSHVTRKELRKERNNIYNNINNFGAFNVRGIRNEWEKECLKRDADKYKIDIAAITETHIKAESNIISLGKHILYTVNEVDSTNRHGTGILIKKSLNPKFKRLTGRICVAEVEMRDTELIFISVYAHTLEIAEQNHELREEFYDTLEGFISAIPSRHEVILAGDFNAKTGSAYEDFSTVMGKFGKGEANNSGIRLLETKTGSMSHKHDFNHKLCHRTTWTAPYREFTTHSGEKRRNPIRNQID